MPKPNGKCAPVHKPPRHPGARVPCKVFLDKQGLKYVEDQPMKNNRTIPIFQARRDHYGKGNPSCVQCCTSIGGCQ